MAYFSREEYEETIAKAEALKKYARQLLVAKKIDGFKYRDLDIKCESVFEKAHIRWRVQAANISVDMRQARQESHLLVMQGDDGKIMRKSCGEWVPTTENELVKLENNGAMLVERKKKQGKVVDIGFAKSTDGDARWRKVSRDDARKLSSEKGVNVRYGEGDSAEVLD
jgi:hypothetical protein